MMKSKLGPLDHLPGALRLANARAERWRLRYMQARKERDDLQLVVDNVTELYEMYMKWDGKFDHPGTSSPRQRDQLAKALGIKDDHQE